MAMPESVDAWGRVTFNLDGERISIEQEGNKLVVRSQGFNTLAVLPHVSNVIAIQTVSPEGLKI